jgi:hypothetical protein
MMIFKELTKSHLERYINNQIFNVEQAITSHPLSSDFKEVVREKFAEAIRHAADNDMSNMDWNYQSWLSYRRDIDMLSIFFTEANDKQQHMLLDDHKQQRIVNTYTDYSFMNVMIDVVNSDMAQHRKQETFDLLKEERNILKSFADKINERKDIQGDFGPAPVVKALNKLIYSGVLDKEITSFSFMKHLNSSEVNHDKDQIYNLKDIYSNVNDFAKDEILFAADLRNLKLTTTRQNINMFGLEKLNNEIDKIPTVFKDDISMEHIGAEQYIVKVMEKLNEFKNDSNGNQIDNLKGSISSLETFIPIDDGEYRIEKNAQQIKPDVLSILDTFKHRLEDENKLQSRSPKFR